MDLWTWTLRMDLAPAPAMLRVHVLVFFAVVAAHCTAPLSISCSPPAARSLFLIFLSHCCRCFWSLPVFPFSRRVWIGTCSGSLLSPLYFLSFLPLCCLSLLLYTSLSTHPGWWDSVLHTTLPVCRPLLPHHTIRQ